MATAAAHAATFHRRRGGGVIMRRQGPQIPPCVQRKGTSNMAAPSLDATDPGTRSPRATLSRDVATAPYEVERGLRGRAHMSRTLRSTQLHVLPSLTRLRDQHGVNLSLCTQRTTSKKENEKNMSLHQPAWRALPPACLPGERVSTTSGRPPPCHDGWSPTGHHILHTRHWWDGSTTSRPWGKLECLRGERDR